MRLLKFLSIMVFCTSLSLAYIHLQVSIYDLGYKAQNKRAQVQKLLDDNSDCNYSIYRLKSSNNLGVKLLSDEKSNLRFLDNDHIVRARNAPGQIAKEGSTKISLNKKSNILTNLFSFKLLREAEADNRN